MEEPVLIRKRFQRPAGCRADADDPAAGALGLVDHICRLLRDHAELGVHMMLGDLLRLDGPEGPETDVQRDIGLFDALGCELFQQLAGKMQTGCRRGGRAVHLGIDRLIALAVFEFFLDVWRQGHFAETLEHLKEDPLIVELHELVAVFLLSDDRRGELSAAEGQFGAGMGLPSRLREAFPDAAALILEQQHLDGAAGRLPMAQQPCREHAGVVHHQTVARLQQVDQIIKMPVRDLAGLPVERHQA